MKANIINVGNSKGIIIPAKFLKMIKIGSAVNIDVKDDRLVITPITKNPRENWSEQFVKANAINDHEMLIPDVFEDENIQDWTW